MCIYRIVLIGTCCILVNVLSSYTYAQSPQSILNNQKQQRWSGTVSSYILAGVGKSSLNNINEDNEQVIHSLDSDPSDYDFSTMYPALRANYNVSNSTYLSLGVFDSGVTSNSLIETQSLTEISINHSFSDESVVWMSISPNIPGLYKVWLDPYQTGRALEKTDASLNTLSLGANYIFGSPLSFSASIGEQNIDNDNAGRYFRSRENN